jgi:hypothetical membrane protein
MTVTTTSAGPTIATTRDDCDRATSTTKSLLGWGVVAGPFYVVVSLAQALVRDGFDLTRHQWSLLANGEYGWIQSLNLVLTGLMLVALGIGLARTIRGGTGAAWVPRLVAVFGIGMIMAGIFRADPSSGFPAGTPDGPGEVTVSGVVHLGASGFGFIAVAIAGVVLAHRFGADRRGMAAFSRVTGAVFLTGFAAVASTGGSVVANLGFTAAVILVFAWLTVVAAGHYRRVQPVTASAR